jgi:tol-pal system protein YbgF
MIKPSQIRFAAIVFALAASLPLRASAGLLDDDEARKAILELRARVSSLEADLKSRIDANNARIDTKADKAIGVDIVNQREQTTQELAKLRGQLEVLANDLATVQKNQRDLYADLDARIKKLEPRQETVDGQTAEVMPSEKKTYDAAVDKVKAGDYKGASAALQDFLRRYPDSAYAGLAQNLLGSAYFFQQDYKNAIAAQQAFIANNADNPRVPDAMLTIAHAYEELKDKKNAKKTYQQLVAKFPKSDAGQTAKERLASLK